MNKEFFEKYKDPRWQKKRLEILERDGFSCIKCGNKKNTLHIHHLYYNNTKDGKWLSPWEYPNEVLITLCEICHEEEKDSRQEHEQLLLYMLKKAGFLSSDIFELAEGFFNFKFLHLSEVVSSSLKWFLSSEEMQKKLLDSYFEYLSKK
jgi:hypothetical protein